MSCELCQPLQKVSLVVVLDLRGQVLVAVKVTGVASVRSCQKLLQCLAEPRPARSRTDPLLAKAEPSSDGSNASDNRLKEKKVLCRSNCSQRRAGWEYVRGTALQTPRSGHKEGQEVLQARCWDSLQPWWGSCVPAAHGGHRDAQIHLQPMEGPTPEQEGGCEPVGSPCWNRVLAGTWRPMERGAHTGAGVLAGFVTLGEPMLEQGVPEKTACVEEWATLEKSPMGDILLCSRSRTLLPEQ